VQRERGVLERLGAAAAATLGAMTAHAHTTLRDDVK